MGSEASRGAHRVVGEGAVPRTTCSRDPKSEKRGTARRWVGVHSLSVCLQPVRSSGTQPQAWVRDSATTPGAGGRDPTNRGTAAYSFLLSLSFFS